MKFEEQKGFTLVELAIVLVIIGLLIGGILAGRSMVQTAAISATVRDLTQYDTSVGNFDAKFKCLPGDCNKFSNGNGDRMILDHNATTVVFSGEIGNFWRDLSFSGLKPNSGYAQFSSPGNGTNLNYYQISGQSGNDQYIPFIPFDKKMGVMAFYNETAPTGNFYRMGRLSTDGGGTGYVVSDWQRGFFPSEAIAFDRKMDDGNSRTGDVMADSSGLLIPSPRVDGDRCESSLGVYDTQLTKRACVMLIRIGGSAGASQ